jgi:hypothetical protein
MIHLLALTLDSYLIHMDIAFMENKGGDMER